ncbi:MAG: polysaccharide deacetylase [Cellvibrionaceae bacterium]|nr:polysaccharide deacetylase [Cellvibrionaceae bacterium]|tara:strand:+ start:17594 stop:18541 length:948 start_codon:yes stop_codon:yes gene_type:complete
MLHSALEIVSALISRNRLSILNYHQVLNLHDSMRPDEPTSQQFDWQMRLLAKYFNPISLNSAVEQLKDGTLARNSVCVTFDDGYLNNLTVAQPILEKYNIPATVFVASAFSGGTNMWNDRIIEFFRQIDLKEVDLSPLSLTIRENQKSAKELANLAINNLKYLSVSERIAKIDELYSINRNIREPRLMMTPKELEVLHNKGVDIEAHTHRHPILKSLTHEELGKEVAENKKLLLEWTGAKITGFAYPNGKFGKDFDDTSINAIRSLGFDYAVSTMPGISTPNSNFHSLCRFTPWDKTPAKFHARLLINLLKGVLG